MQRRLLTNGNAFKRTDDRWDGVVWYMDEHGERKRKSFSGTTKAEVNKKMTDYIADFENQAVESDESKKALQDSMQNWLQVFKFPSVEQTTYDQCECSAQNQIYPLLGDKPVGDITAADIKNLLNYWMNKGYAYTTVKKAYVVLNEYFRYLYREELIPKNPMANVEMMKKSNFMSAQDKEDLPECETVTNFYTGRNREVQSRSVQHFQRWQTQISAGCGVYPDAEHRITHRRTARPAEQRH